MSCLIHLLRPCQKCAVAVFIAGQPSNRNSSTLSVCTVHEARCLCLRRRQPRNVTAHCGVQTQHLPHGRCRVARVKKGLRTLPFPLRNEAPPELCLVTFYFCKITKPSKMELIDKVQQIYEEQVFFPLLFFFLRE